MKQIKALLTKLLMSCTLLGTFSCAKQLTKPISVDGGKIQGELLLKEQVAFFRGIPFAAPPVDSLRWKPPQPVIPWEGVKETTKFSPWAIQLNSEEESEYIKHMAKGIGHNWFVRTLIPLALRIMPPQKQSEDCLYLNVRTANLGKREKQPVMVWIHGGAKQFGSGAEHYYHSNDLIQKGVVVVTINYRLGLFGYFAHPELSQESPHNSSGNYGLLDQIAALKWVKKNIAQFGGDPNNVTIVGQSSGGEAVIELLCSPLAKGLFHKAISQSGSMTTISELTRSPILLQEKAEQEGEKWANSVGLTSLEVLRSISADSLMKLQFPSVYNYAFHYQTVLVDDWSMPQGVVHALKDGNQTKVPLIAGYTANEGDLFYPISKFPTPSNWDNRVPTDQEKFHEFLRDIYLEDSDSLIKLYGLSNPETRLQGEMDMRGEEVNGVHMYHLCNEMEKSGTPSYFYFFSRIPISKRQSAGAYHSSDVPFVFGTHDRFFKANKKDIKLREELQNYWVQFMKTGDPNYAQQPKWSTWSKKHPRWMNFNYNLRDEPISRRAKLELLEKTLLRKIEEFDPQNHLSSE